MILWLKLFIYCDRLAFQQKNIDKYAITHIEKAKDISFKSSLQIYNCIKAT